MNDILISLLLGAVEGLTEFLPVSSTGHLILLNEYLGFTGPFARTFDLVIQFGTILAVLIYFRAKLIPKSLKNDKAVEIWKKAAAGFLPILVIGAIWGPTLQKLLFTPHVVATALIAGGLVLLVVERKRIKPKIGSIDSLGYKTAFIIGLFQCLSMVPGTSRSAATIVGALLLGVSRAAAVEYSFFLAIPTLTAASAYSLLKSGLAISGHQILLLLVGFIASFAVAYVVIAGFVKYISKGGFAPFGVYRIVLGLAVLYYFGLP
jgi:undecaprenyl-diphosphatase